MSTGDVEKRFQNFKQEIGVDNFNSVVFLNTQANQLKAKDPALSQRIGLRVLNLTHQQKVRETNPFIRRVKAITALLRIWSKPIASKASALLKSITTVANPFVLVVLVPTFLFALYQTVVATGRFESEAKIIVQQPDSAATMDTSMAMLTGLGVPSDGIVDTELVKAYILSNDMFKHLDDNVQLKAHYSQDFIDWFSRLPSDASQEDAVEYYNEHVDVQIDSQSNIITVSTQGFSGDYATLLLSTIVERAEWYINSIGHQMAEAQLKFIKTEHENIEQKLETAKSNLLQFQSRYNLIDPTAEGAAMQQITYGLESQISAKEAELDGLLSIMSPSAPRVVAVKSELTALQKQLQKERNKLSTIEASGTISVSQILGQYTDLKVKMELALQAYTGSQVSLEKSRIEAYRQLKYLVTVASPSAPESAKYPNASYNILLMFVALGLLFVVGRIILSTIRELR